MHIWCMYTLLGPMPWVNTLRLRQNYHHFANDIFKCIFLNENVWILLKISLKFVNKVWINNIPSLVQLMAWRLPGDKPLSEPMMISLLTHIWVTRPQWIMHQSLIWDPSLVISLPADVLAPTSAQPLADTALTTKLNIIFWKLSAWMILEHF